MPDETEVPVRPNDVAVIGMSGRFPGAPDLDTFWSRLRNGDELLTTYTDAELAAAGVPERVRRDPRYVPRAAVLPDAFDFDPGFFGYTRREAKLMDPQQRLMLEVAAELLDTIGYAGGAGDQAVGVFAGAAMNSYLANVVARSCDLLTYDGIELMVANDKDYLTTRISYKLDLTGPSVAVQTACSTSLVAVHVAAQSLIAGECDIALAGGVSVIANPYPGYVHGEGMMFSPDGRCRPFDVDADGTTFGDGVGLVALKRLAEAIEDGDRVLAVLKGSAVNNDGSAKIGYTAPSVEGQRAVISEAHAIAEVGSDTITYVEAHGTATALGDPIEFDALSEAFVAGGARPGQCALGSVKANVGHLAAAAGIAGFIKTVLALGHREIPGHPTFTRPNPRIDLDGSPFHINTSPLSWPQGATPRRAAVSSFAIGGTNAHVVLEEAPPLPARLAPAAGPRLLAVSAKSDRALRELAERLAGALAGPDAPDLADAAFTLRAGRREFAYRGTVVAEDHATAVDGLRAIAAGAAAQAAEDATDVAALRGIAAGTAAWSAEDQATAVAGRPIATAARAAEAVPAVSFLFGEVPPENFRVLADRLPAVAAIAQRSGATPAPGLVLATLWAESGARPDAVGGAGSGEVLAACFAGVLDETDALALLSWRAGLLDSPPQLRPQLPRIPILSAVVGGELPPARALDPLHWTRDVWTGSRLAEAFAGRTGDAATVVNIGIPAEPLPEDVTSSPVARLLHDAARLWTAGVPVDWSDWFGDEPRRVPLPAHPLYRSRLRLDEAGPPRGEELKRLLAKLWTEVLRTEVDRYDLSIFDIDDDPVLAVRLARRIGTELGVSLTAIELLRHPTIDRLAAQLDRAG
ncbi:beta-ketoacyl synthase N-terminal-like domain-containing protein [Amycolatopsis sp. NEAU-NG30]|uniref:Beta-ketoacyl synthase N-terminal-like domain-containing protein n=1 Tax=Amycolatopsis melonis TaxID=3156488 RepID=A0ABV0LBF4_9PSEU